MDWHFRTNQRMAESAQRGQSRSWYVDELVSIAYYGSMVFRLNVHLRNGSGSGETKKMAMMILRLVEGGATVGC